MIFTVGMLILASVAAVQGIATPTVTVDCSATGFEPKVSQGYTDVAIEVQVIFLRLV